MNPYKLHNALETSSLVLLVAFAAACGAPNASTDSDRDESFLALMGSDGKADAFVVTDGSPEAHAVLEVTNTLSFADLETDVGLDHRATANIVAHRDRNAADLHDDNPYDTLVELDHTPWVGMSAFRNLFEYARDHGVIDAMRNPQACTTDADCGTGMCNLDRCYDVATIEVDQRGDATFEVANDGTWWVRAHDGGTTVRETRGSDRVDSVDTSSYPDVQLSNWLTTLPDGSLTAVTRSDDDVIPEFGPTLTLATLNVPVDVAYDTDGSLLVAAEAQDTFGTSHGLIVLRQEDDGWRQELKQAFDGERDPDEQQTTRFTRAADGSLQVWVDIDDAARRFDRDAHGNWHEAVVLDMAGAGFGERAADRSVEFLQADDGTVFVYRTAWSFARKHQVVRIEGDMVTAVIDLPTATRRVAAHPSGDLTIVYADGSLGKVHNGEELHGTLTLSAPLGPDDLVRTRGDDLFILRAGGTLQVLRAR